MARRMPADPGVITKDKGIKSHASRERRLKHEMVLGNAQDIREIERIARYEIRMGIENARRVRAGEKRIGHRNTTKRTTRRTTKRTTVFRKGEARSRFDSMGRHEDDNG